MGKKQFNLDHELTKLFPNKFRLDSNLGLMRFYDGRWMQWQDYLKAVTSNRNGMLGLSPNN